MTSVTWRLRQVLVDDLNGASQKTESFGIF